MKTLLLKLEPIIWLLFGGGILVGTLLLPGCVLVVALGAAARAAPGGRALLRARPRARCEPDRPRWSCSALIALPLWKGAHHLRPLAIDFGGAARRAWSARLLYAVAALGQRRRDRRRRLALSGLPEQREEPLPRQPSRVEAPAGPARGLDTRRPAV